MWVGVVCDPTHNRSELPRHKARHGVHRVAEHVSRRSMYGGSFTTLACGKASVQLSRRRMLALRRSVVRGTAQNYFRLVAIEKRSAWPNTLAGIHHHILVGKSMPALHDCVDPIESELVVSVPT